jgi:colicin import membrane protein
MAAAALSRHDARPTSPGGEWQGVLLSLLVHAGLVAVLLLGFRWQAPPPAAATAELWAAPPQVTAVNVPPPPAPPPRVEAPPPKPPPATAQADADIALEQARKAKAEQERLQQERLAKEQRELREKREKAEKAEKAEREAKLERARQAEAAEKAAKADREAKARLEAQRREQAAAEKALARQREENLARMMGQLGSAATGTESRGTAAAGGGGGAPSASYAGRVIQAIKPNIVFAETLAGNPAAEVEVRTGPAGTIIGSTLTRSSGHPEWDNAVLRAVERTGTLPKDTDGRVPPRLTITFRPKD